MISRCLLCVRLPEMWPSSVGWRGTGEGWRRAFTRHTTSTWRRRMAKGSGPLFEHRLPFWWSVDGCSDTCFSWSPHQGVSDGRKKKKEVQNIQLSDFYWSDKSVQRHKLLHRKITVQCIYASIYPLHVRPSTKVTHTIVWNAAKSAKY